MLVEETLAASDLCGVTCLYDVLRSLVAYLGAANHFSKEHLEIAENRELMEKAHYFYMAVSVVWLVSATVPTALALFICLSVIC